MDTTSIRTELTYQNILSKFFVDNKLVSERKERIENGFAFVVSNVPKRDLSTHLQNIIRKKVTSFEVSFVKKWRGSRCKSMAEFQQLHDKWIHLVLQLPSSITSANSHTSIREKKRFGQLSDRQKNRRADEDLGGYNVDQLLLASSKAAQQSNELDLSYVLRQLYHDHEKATVLRRLLKTHKF